MIKYLSPTVLAAVLRVSSTPVFSIQLALTSLLLREKPADETVHRAMSQESANHV